ncbi:MAG: polysaccharide biosynthesis/export family protein [Muribaculaceae bacterium]|nr:polysaccharide biosynthesis/export family protein [Muribaculaceae bacterium]
MKSRLLIMLVASVMLFSCKTNKENNLAYFHNLNDIPSGVLPNPQSSYPIVVQPDDELIVAVTSAVPEATAAYNLPLENPATRNALRMATQPRTQTYIVDKQGDIMLPLLGRIHVAGKTTEQIANEVTAMVAKDVKDPYVKVDIVNFTVDVMGEVRVPQRVVAERQHFTVLDALATCNDLTEYGKRDRVYVIRTENGERTYHRLDLTNSEVFSDPYFYLRQNDIVYVEPNQIRIDNSKYNQNNAFKLSVTSTIVSGVSVIASLIIALTR